MKPWQSRFDKEINDTLKTIFDRANKSLPDGYVILGVSYQLFVEGVGEYRYRLDVAEIGDGGTDERPEISNVSSACFDGVPGDGVIEDWMKVTMR